MDDGARDLLKTAINQLEISAQVDISAQVYGRILKVARTHADLDGGEEQVQFQPIAKAINYRVMDRKLLG